jgi:pyruvate kinase
METVKMMHEIIINAEQHFIQNDNIKFQVPEVFEENLFDSVLKGITSVSDQIKADAIVVFTYKGRAARGLAKFRPSSKIIAISDSFETMNKLCLRWGVNSLFIDKIDKQNAAIKEAIDLILNAGLVKKGNLVIFLSRAPVSESGRSDFFHFEVL